MNTLKRKGFSLIEMILVITIMGIIAGTLAPLADTKKIKQEAVKSLSNEVFQLQESLISHYIDSNGSAQLRFRDDINDLLTNGYLSVRPNNPFFANTDQFKFKTAQQTINGVPKDIGMEIGFTIPKQYLAYLKMYLPQIKEYDPVGTFIRDDGSTPAALLMGQTYVTSFIPIPGNESSHDNLLHRDSASPLALRTMHGQIAVADNTDGSQSRIVISNAIPQDNVNNIIDANGYAYARPDAAGETADVVNGTQFGSLTVGFLENNLVGIRGVTPGSSNFIIDAYNPNKTDGGSTTDPDRGHVVIGSYASDGVILGGFEETDARGNGNIKSRVLVDDEGAYFASYDYPGGSAPQWISKIDDQGQTWHSKVNHDYVVAKIDATNGQMVSRHSVGVAKDPDTSMRWGNALEHKGIGDFTAALMNMSEFDGINPSGALTNGRDQGALMLRDSNGSGAIITKDKEFFGPSFIGSILHVGHYGCGVTIPTFSYANGLPCRGGFGVVKPVVVGSSGMLYTGQTMDPRATLSQPSGTITTQDWGFKGSNRYIDNNGVITCETIAKGRKMDTDPGTTELNEDPGFADLHLINIGASNYKYTNSSISYDATKKGHLQGIITVMYICWPN